MIYLDNAATSFPKPEAVYDAVNGRFARAAIRAVRHRSRWRRAGWLRTRDYCCPNCSHIGA